MTWLQRTRDSAAGIALIVCVPVAVLLSNLYLVASTAYVRYEYARPGFPEASLYTKDERLALAEATLQYMRSHVDSQYLTSLQPQGQPIYNPREVSHLIDAKRVMRAAFAVHATCAFFASLAFVVTWRTTTLRRRALLAISNGCLAFLALLAGIGLLAYLDFGLFFTTFHRLFFEGDSWLFPRTDTLIQLFPVAFWMDATLLIAGLTLIECLVVGLAARALATRFRDVP